MSYSSVNVTEGSGKRLATWDRTISSVLVQEQAVHRAEPYLPTYSLSGVGAVSVATTSAHVMQIMAGSSLHVRINRIWITQYDAASAAAALNLQLLRLTTAGTTVGGGTAITAAPYDTGDAAAGATGITLPNTKGTESTRLFMKNAYMSATAGGGNSVTPWWEAHPGGKPIIIPAGTSNGICLKVGTGVTGATVYVTVEFTETAWL